MISIIFPTRKRPQNVIRLVDSILSTADDANNLELCLYLDEDDTESVSAVANVAERISTQALCGNLKIGSQMYNELYRIIDGEIIMFAADDIVFKTKGWDTIVTKKFDEYPDKILFVYGEDGYQHGRIGTHGFIHANWADTVGYVLPPQLASAYTDEWVTELDIRVNRNCYIPELVVEHLHPANGKAPNDSTYTNRTEIAGDIGAFYRSLEKTRIEDAEKLQQFIKEFQP